MLITMLYIMQHISKLPHYYSVVPKEIINFATFLNQNRKNMKAFVFPTTYGTIYVTNMVFTSWPKPI